MTKDYLRPAKNVLLTGAGFSKDFGGLLASEMWAALLNEVTQTPHPALQNELFKGNNLDFEQIYVDVLGGGLNQSEKDAFTDALRQAYTKMHHRMEEHGSKATTVFQKFISKFNPDNTQDLGFFFTLNQDLLVEFNWKTSPSLMIPGINLRAGSEKITEGNEIKDVRLPTAEKLEVEKAKFWAKNSPNFVYIKLHGSLNWKKADGSSAMVVGHVKSGIIANEPLLKWYGDLFKQVLTSHHPETRNLLVIGYGFRDDHINDVIWEGIQNGLKVYILCPSEPKTMQQAMCGPGENIPSRGRDIWKKLQGYYPCSAKDLAASSTVDPTALGRELLTHLGISGWRK